MKTQQPEQPAQTLRPDAARPDVIDGSMPLILTVSERFLLSILLPQTGTRTDMATAAAIEQTIAFDEGEALAFGIRYTNDGAMLFDKDTAVGFDFNDGHISLIHRAVERADVEERITREMLPLLAKIDLLRSDAR